MHFLERTRARRDYLHIAWLILLGTGMRRGELVALRWRDVDLENGRIVIQRSYHYIKQMGVAPVKGFGTPKSGKPRVVDIDPSLVAALAFQRETQASLRGEVTRESLVLPNRFGEPLNPERLTEQFRARVRAAQVDNPALPLIKLHGLRHTHATLLLSEGIHPKVVQERLGHANILITLNTYSHVLPTLQRAAATAIGDLLSGQSQMQQEDRDQ
jgi:integrase